MILKIILKKKELSAKLQASSTKQQAPAGLNDATIKKYNENRKK